MKAKVIIADEQGVVLGQFTLDEDDADAEIGIVQSWIGELVLEQLPRGVEYLRAKNESKP